jgi:predicted O-methyltransferase YrrM
VSALAERLRRRLAPGAGRLTRPTRAARARAFRQDDHGRFWWHHLNATDYEPPIYATLDDDEWRVMRNWYAATAARNAIGEINVPAMSLVQGLVTGNGLRRIVQLGHFYGYSALLIGFMLRRMGGQRTLFSVDIDEEATRFTQTWVDRAGVQDVVALRTGDSADPRSRDAALQAIGGAPELVIVDSSHQYGHTLRELDLWVACLPPAGLMLLHDVSVYAESFDAAGAGGVRRALAEWVADRDYVALLNLNGDLPEGTDPNEVTYKDGCGMGILQRVA